MKAITNWRNASVADMEGDALLDEITLLHVVCVQLQGKGITTIKGSNHKRIKAMLQYHIDEGIPLVGHNFICFDIPVFEKLLGIDLSELMVIDTIVLSYYLELKRKKHGLAAFHDDYGIAKVEVGPEEWVLPPQGDATEDEYSVMLEDHYALMKLRCRDDVRINKPMWEDFKLRLEEMYTLSKGVIDKGLVGGKRVSDDEVIYLDRFKGTTSVDEWVDNILTFLMMKQGHVRIKEKTKWEVDVKAITGYRDDWTSNIDEAKAILESVMAEVPEYKTKKFPKKPLKKGKKKDSPMELSASGEGWNEAMKLLTKKNDHGHQLVKADKGVPHSVAISSWSEGTGEGVSIKILSKYNPPNAGSPDQIKALLFSHGWVPRSFKFVDDKEAMDAWQAKGRKGRKPNPRSVPQVSIDKGDGKELCPSVLELAKSCPEVDAYSKYTTIKHRRDTAKGWIENLEGGKYLSAGCQGYTNCMTADTLILTDSGHIPIVDVRKGDRVLTHEGQYKKVTDWIDNGIKPVLRITLKSGQELKCTDNHRVMTPKGWVYARDLEVGTEATVYGGVESWSEIEGFAGCKVSTWGRVMGLFGNIYTSKRRNSADIRCNVTLPIRGSRGKDFVVSRLVMEAFVGESELHVLHKDGNPNNNNIKNLYYGTDADNRKDAALHGTHISGCRNRKDGKLTEELAGEIRDLCAGAPMTQKSIGESYGVSVGMIACIKRGRSWNKYTPLKNLYREKFDSCKIVSVEKLLPVPTFDLSVSENHSYVANGVVVHNTLREKHRGIVNVPGVDKLYGKELRGSLLAGRGCISLGSDLSALEDRVKQMLMLPHDPEYVATMSVEGFCPHIDIAEMAKFITEEEGGRYRSDKFLDKEDKKHIKNQRKRTKPVNYGGQYGQTAKGLARSADIPLDQAEEITRIYLERNWAVKVIAEEQVVITDSRRQMWLVNPVNGLCYSLRSPKDRFSTLCQGTGSFIFDMWIDVIMREMYSSFKVKRLNGLFHDEFITSFRDTKANRDKMTKITLDAIEEVNQRYLLRRPMGADVQYGDTYAQIH